jgi:hypothetical protein
MNSIDLAFNQSGISGTKITFYAFYIVLGLVTEYSTIFISMFMNELGLKFCFYLLTMSGIGIKTLLASQNELRCVLGWSVHPGPMNVIFFVNRVFADVLS